MEAKDGMRVAVHACSVYPFIMDDSPQKLTQPIKITYVTAVGCPGLSDPVNGVLTSTGTNTGDSVAFTCNSGFELVGASVVHCLSNGTWDKPSPVCLTPAGNNVSLMC